ncbi:MAG: DUF2017 family protein [Acidimicrobiales bacterium]|nr:DUF2017 family protein [Acidimicrobiales bacterium]
MIRRRVVRDRSGAFKLRLPAEERDILRSVGPGLRELLVDRATAIEPGEDEAVDRLFPVAYPDDDERQAEFRLLAHDQLLESHLGALTILEETIDADRLDEEQVLAWMRALNHIRLVIGVNLGITEERDEWPESMDDPRAPGFVVYQYLTYLQGEIIEVLASA